MNSVHFGEVVEEEYEDADLVPVDDSLHVEIRRIQHSQKHAADSLKPERIAPYPPAVAVLSARKELQEKGWFSPRNRAYEAVGNVFSSSLSAYDTAVTDDRRLKHKGASKPKLQHSTSKSSVVSFRMGAARSAQVPQPTVPRMESLAPSIKRSEKVKTKARQTHDIVLQNFVHPSVMDKTLRQMIADSNHRALTSRSGHPAYTKKQLDASGDRKLKLPSLDLSKVHNLHRRNPDNTDANESVSDDEEDVFRSPTGVPVVHTKADWQHVKARISGVLHSDRKHGFVSSEDRETEFKVLRAALTERKMELAKVMIDTLNEGSEDRAAIYKRKYKALDVSSCSYQEGLAKTRRTLAAELETDARRVREKERAEWFSQFLREHFDNRRSAFTSRKNSTVVQAHDESSDQQHEHPEDHPDNSQQARVELQVNVDREKMERRRRFEKFTLRHLRQELCAFIARDLHFSHEEFLSLCERFTPLELILNGVQSILLALAGKFAVAPADFGRYLLSRSVPLAVCFPNGDLETADSQARKDRSFFFGNGGSATSGEGRTSRSSAVSSTRSNI